MQFKISQGKGLRGDITIPGDKSISHRAVMLASLAEGKSKISGLLEEKTVFQPLKYSRN